MLTRALTCGSPFARLLVAACLTLATSCERATSKSDVLVLGENPGGDVVFATKNCEVVNADGKRCDKKTCKADDKSNCEYFASRCLATGHNYTGTAEAGTCSRASPDN
jgi:hypothetical protein